ncbi:Uncharacterised protein [Serratia marcescens]|uniref:Uncharacterized protein n=1 Tax=Serratia marcescens TaxID=615 RepID=A0A379YZZ5_SERMA|nr:Uncharacterised protein [Serratia marcescens]
MKKIMTRTLTAAALLLAASQAFAVEAPKRTECIAPAKARRRLRFDLQADSGVVAGHQGHR